MPRLRNVNSGVVVSVSDETAGRLDSEWAPVDADAESGSGYGDQKVADLKAEIAQRNEGREEADLIPGDGNKADLIAALEADDTRNQ